VAAVRSGLDVPGRSPGVEPAGARDSRISRYFLLWILAGFRSVRRGFRGGWAVLAANTVLAALAIGMPLSESLTG
jgi:hypothetical protein